jgi:hypothetical protein
MDIDDYGKGKKNPTAKAKKAKKFVSIFVLLRRERFVVKFPQCLSPARRAG